MKHLPLGAMPEEKRKVADKLLKVTDGMPTPDEQEERKDRKPLKVDFNAFVGDSVMLGPDRYPMPHLFGFRAFTRLLTGSEGHDAFELGAALTVILSNLSDRSLMHKIAHNGMEPIAEEVDEFMMNLGPADVPKFIADFNSFVERIKRAFPLGDADDSDESDDRSGKA
jgi:hypothetical protein